jgi:hypothetical protein
MSVVVTSTGSAQVKNSKPAQKPKDTKKEK